MAFVIFMHPIFLVFEKALKVHTRSFYLRVLVRIPVVAFMFFLALAVPFFGPINGILGSLGVAIAMYMIPPITFLIVYRTKSAREVICFLQSHMKLLIYFRTKYYCQRLLQRSLAQKCPRPLRMVLL